MNKARSVVSLADWAVLAALAPAPVWVAASDKGRNRVRGNAVSRGIYRTLGQGGYPPCFVPFFACNSQPPRYNGAQPNKVRFGLGQRRREGSARLRMEQKTPGARPTGDHTVILNREPLTIPLNLSEWVPAPRLAAWIKECILNLDRTRPEVRECLPSHPGERPDSLLAVLSYAYLTQVFCSDEVVRSCHADRTLRGLCDDQPPFEEELEHYRRVHRRLLIEIITSVLARAIREKFNLEGIALPPALERSLTMRAGARVDTARHMDNLG